jgi:hypothetical protein
MSKMIVPDDEPVQAPVQGSWRDRWVDIEPTQLPLAARWVDIPPVTPPPNESASDPELRMMMSVLALIVITLTLAIVKVLFPRRPRHRGKKSGLPVTADDTELSIPAPAMLIRAFSSESLCRTWIAGWISARVKETRQNKIKSQKPGSDSIRTGTAPGQNKILARMGV